jgi:hypothetical protein
VGIKGEKGLWIKTAEDWVLINLIQSDIVKAIERLRRANMSISGPQSVTNTARAIHNEPVRMPEDTLVIDPATGRASRPDYTPGVIKIDNIPGWAGPTEGTITA